MSDIRENMRIIGCRGKVDSVDEFIQQARDFLSDHGTQDATTLQFIDADFVLGKEHILMAVEYAQRAFERKENISSSLGIEILIYAAGEPQINNAIKKIGLKDGNEKVAVIMDEGLDEKTLLSVLNLQRDDDVLTFEEYKLKKIGIDEIEFSAVKKDSVLDLVLERVAMVDVKK
jgi:tRNA threonylcarbamoyladenosine modification (KEOPS) complex Cgi121 subunit